MIKFKTADDKGNVKLGFGISEENVRLLKQGKPILINLREMGIDAEVMIFYGKTEKDILNDIKPFIGEDTITHGV